MGKNYSELQYLNVLRKIIIKNAKDEYQDTVNQYLMGELSVKDTYELLLKKGNNNLKNVLRDYHMDRTGTGTYKIFGEVMRFDLTKGFPLLTTKKVYTRAIFEELFWFIKGETNIKPLVDKNVRIWNEWPYEKYTKTDEYKNNPITLEEFVERIKADENFALKHGDLGPVYGAQWRNFGGHDHFKTSIVENLSNPEFKTEFDSLCKKYNLMWEGNNGVDQLKEVIDKLKNRPNDRRMLVFSYNPKEVQDQALPACHAFFQFYVKDNELSCMMYQRSCDMFLGVPFNIASYAALTHLIAQVTGLKAKEFIHILGDTHIYSNHIEQVQLQLSREPYDMPQLYVDPSVKNIEDFNIENVEVLNYKSHDKITGEVSV
ncbi:MAG: thymidylate synthase [Bacilli bacterium]|nr:thymidylate synthase [Bacilli bacterium]